MVGKRFGRLVVIFRAGRTKHHNATWWCKCDCGGERIVSGEQLVRKVAPTIACEDCKRTRLATTAKDYSSGRWAKRRAVAEQL
jgi:hypothetical protein